MNAQDFGVPTLHTRVERWETDHNNHWNTRFYGRSFQLASEAVVARFGDRSPVSTFPHIRHMRFHRELATAANLAVRSAILRDAAGLNGLLVHVLVSGGTVSATALESPAGRLSLPEVTAAEVSLALPRGLEFESAAAWPDAGATSGDVQFGTIRPSQLDPHGHLLFEEVIRLCSVASSLLLENIGFTPEFTRQTAINRMAVEMRVMRHRSPEVGTVLHGQSRLAEVMARSFRTAHRIMSGDGSVVAAIDICQVTVNLESRRSVQVPRLVLDAWHSQEEGVAGPVSKTRRRGK